MSDGSIKIAIEVDGKEVKVASKDLDKLEKAGLESGKGIKAAEDSMDGLADSSQKASDKVKKAKDETKGAGDESRKASGNIKKFATALGLVAIGAAAFAVLKSSMDDAISRFDTLNKFPKVLQALGVSAEDSERAMSKLSDGIDGLPTKLDEISSNAQRMYTSFNDMDKATDSALALNNALLGSGSSAADAQRGTEQYIKFLQTGKMEMDSWNTLQETMDIGLIKVAESFGYAGKSAKQDLYDALKDGIITADQFNDKLIEVGTGTGIMAKLAKENSLGIATSLGNLKNAAARGIANIIDSFNKLSKEVTGKDIAQNIDGLKSVVNASFKVIGNVIEGASPYVKAFASTVKATLPIVKALSPALMGLASAYAFHKVVYITTTAIKANTVATTIAKVAKNAYAIATNRLSLAMTLAVVKQKIMTAALISYNKIVAIATTVQAMLTAGISLASVATIGLSGAISILGTAIKVLLGPVGWITAGVGALAGAVVGIVKWFKRSSAEAKRLNKETEELGESTDALNDSIAESSDAYKNNQDELKANAKANEELAKRIDELSKKENKSASDKALLNSYIEELNGSVEGLNLAYNKEADALSMSSEQLQARIGLMKDQEKAQEAQSRLTEILQEQAEVEGKLAETNELRAEWNKKLEEGSVKANEHFKAIKELEEQEASLTETLGGLSEQQAATEEQISTSMEAITAATQSGIANQKIAYEDLSETQQKTIDNMKATWEDYKEKATDMFDTLSDKSKISVSEMTSNLAENQRIIGEWADNIAVLADRGVDEGLLNTLREAGPESAGHVNALVKASDAELEKLSETFAKGGDAATDALSKSLGIEKSNLLDAVSNLVIDTEKSLRDQIKASDFESIGIHLPEGLGAGIDKGSPKAETASKDMAIKVSDSFKSAAAIKSPSRVFKEHGVNITEGLVLGINQGTSKVITAIQDMFKKVQTNSVNSFKEIAKDHDQSVKNIEDSLNKLPEIAQKSMKNMLNRLKSEANTQIRITKSLASKLIRSCDRTPGQFDSIGRNAMSGLNQGLWAGKGRVMSTARSIANSVASTMQSALRIHSPSRVMRDEVGKWIPAGLAEGIKRYSGLVGDATSSMMQYATPEAALGTNKMAYGNGTNQVMNIFNNNTTSSPSAEKLKVEAGDVYLDGYKVGNVIWRPVKENIDRDMETKKAFGGR